MARGYSDAPELICVEVAQVFRPARDVANRAEALFHFTSPQLDPVYRPSRRRWAAGSATAP